jgi:type IV pilus assembly protein PilO
MTNFLGSQPRKAPWFTPERLVLVLPAAGGGLVALLILLLGLPPLLVQVNQRREAITTLEAQEAELPLLRSQLVASQQQLQRKSQQKDRLLTLVAGTAELRTWIGGLNDLASATGVNVTQVEPGSLEVYVPPPPDPAAPPPPPAAAPAAAATTDPLLVQGLQKRSAMLTVRGRYPDLRRFLQQLENLQVIALASDLDLKAAVAAQPATTAGQAQGQSAPVRLELRLKVSAYGRAPGQAAPP